MCKAISKFFSFTFLLFFHIPYYLIIVTHSCFRYRAIMYPLRRKPTKLFSKIIILIIWVLGLAFAVPMGIVYTFEYVPVNEEEKELKPFCHLNFGPNATNSTELLMFQYYRYVDFSLFFVILRAKKSRLSLSIISLMQRWYQIQLSSVHLLKLVKKSVLPHSKILVYFFQSDSTISVQCILSTCHVLY